MKENKYRRLITITVAILLLAILSHSAFAQQTFPIGNKTARNEALGEYFADSALRAPTVKKVYQWWDSAGNLAVVNHALWFHDGTKWNQIDSGGHVISIYNRYGTIIYGGDSIAVDTSIIFPAYASTEGHGYALLYGGRTYAFDSATAFPAYALTEGHGYAMLYGGRTYTFDSATAFPAYALTEGHGYGMVYGGRTYILDSATVYSYIRSHFLQTTTIYNKYGTIIYGGDSIFNDTSTIFPAYALTEGHGYALLYGGRTYTFDSATAFTAYAKTEGNGYGMLYGGRTYVLDSATVYGYVRTNILQTATFDKVLRNGYLSNYSQGWLLNDSLHVSANYVNATSFNGVSQVNNIVGSYGGRFFNDGTGTNNWVREFGLGTIMDMSSYYFRFEDSATGNQMLIKFQTPSSATGLDSVLFNGTLAGSFMINQAGYPLYSIPYVGNGNNYKNIAIGSAGNVLTVNGSANGYTWSSGVPTTSNLQVVTDNGNTTTDSVVVKNLEVKGSGFKFGYIALDSMSGVPTGEAGKVKIFMGALGNFGIQQSTGFTEFLKTDNLLANQSMTFPRHNFTGDSISTLTLSSGTGFVKGSSGTISFDNSTYIASGSAAGGELAGTYPNPTILRSITPTMTAQWTFSVTPILASMTSGSIPFIGTSGKITQSNSTLFWDSTNHRLGINTITPTSSISSAGTNTNTSISLQASGSTILFPTFVGKSSRGVVGAESNSVNGDAMFSLVGQAYSGSFQSTAEIDMYISGTFTSGQRPPSRISFSTNTVNASPAERISIAADGTLVIGPSVDLGISRQAAGVLDIGNGTFQDISGTIDLTQINIKEGSNKAMGVSALSSGTVTVSTTAITANSRVILTLQNCSTCGVPYLGTVTAGTSFVINSTNVLDASSVLWLIINKL